MKTRHLAGAVALVAAAGLALTGCSGSGDGDGGDDKGEIKLGYITGWTDGESLTYLAKNQLEKEGYEVDVEEYTDNGVTYTGLAGGDFDVFASAWPEVTQKSYWDKYGDDLEDLDAYYDGAVLTIAVPDYMDDVNSIADLKGQADRFDGKIIGIEPGAGLTEATEKMLPEYGLDKEYELVTSSTATMLATLQDKVDKKEDVVVTLWRPFWANDAFPVKDLEDPKGAMGDPEALHILAKKGFQKEFPEAADLLGKIKLDDKAYGALESLVTGDDFKDDPEGAVKKWIEENPDAYDGLITD